jgi:limonene-1,2-epoxide hydrolase
MAKGWIEIAVVGVWELRGGKIALWRSTPSLIQREFPFES